MSQIKDTIKVIIVSSLASSFISLGVYFAIAQTWSGPTANPPGNNVLPPLNAGPAGQSKSGGLILNTGGAPNGLIVNSGATSLGGQLNMNGNKVTNLAAPTGDTDAVSLSHLQNYVSAQTSGPYWAYRTCTSISKCTASCPAGTTIQGWGANRADKWSGLPLGEIKNTVNDASCGPVTLGVSTSLTCLHGFAGITVGIICSK